MRDILWIALIFCIQCVAAGEGVAINSKIQYILPDLPMVFIKCDNFTKSNCYWRIDQSDVYSGQISKQYKGLRFHAPNTLVVGRVYACAYNKTKYGCSCMDDDENDDNDDRSIDTEHVYCKVNYCPPLGDLTNGEINCRDSDDIYFDGDTCNFKCNDGFHLNGINRTTCQNHGKWNVTTAVTTCVKDADFSPNTTSTMSNSTDTEGSGAGSPPSSTTVVPTPSSNESSTPNITESPPSSTTVVPTPSSNASSTPNITESLPSSTTVVPTPSSNASSTPNITESPPSSTTVVPTPSSNESSTPNITESLPSSTTVVPTPSSNESSTPNTTESPPSSTTSNASSTPNITESPPLSTTVVFTPSNTAGSISIENSITVTTTVNSATTEIPSPTDSSGSSYSFVFPAIIVLLIVVPAAYILYQNREKISNLINGGRRRKVRYQLLPSSVGEALSRHKD